MNYYSCNEDCWIWNPDFLARPCQSNLSGGERRKEEGEGKRKREEGKEREEGGSSLF